MSLSAYRGEPKSHVVVYVVCSLLFALSACALCVQLGYTDDDISAKVAVAASFIAMSALGICLLPKLWRDRNFGLMALALLFSVCLAYGSLDSGIVYVPWIPIAVNSIKWNVLGIPASFFILYLILVLARKLFLRLNAGLEKADRIICTVFFCAATILVIALYVSSDRWYQQYDVFYSLDSAYCFDNMFHLSGYYDIRHPIFGQIAHPLWCICYGLSRVFVPAPLVLCGCAVMLQALNIAALLVIGAILRVLTKRTSVLVLFLCAFSTMLFVVFFEKYVLCTFFVVLSVFTTLNYRKWAPICYVLAIGMMPTSAFIVFFLLLYAWKAFGWKAVLRICVATFVIGVFALACTGHIDIVATGSIAKDVNDRTDMFAGRPRTIIGGCLSCLNLIYGAFLPPSTYVHEGEWSEVLSWIPLDTLFESLSIVLLFFVLIGVFTSFKKGAFLNLCFAWLVFVPILFIGFNWSPDESALFSVYFSWALIPLFAAGVAKVSELMRIDPNKVMGAFSAVCFATSFGNLVYVNSLIAAGLG